MFSDGKKPRDLFAILMDLPLIRDKETRDALLEGLSGDLLESLEPRPSRTRPDLLKIIKRVKSWPEMQDGTRQIDILVANAIKLAEKGTKLESELREFLCKGQLVVQEEGSQELKALADQLPSEQASPTIGIITALPKEYAAVKVVLEKRKEHSPPGRGAGRRYLLGEVPAAGGDKHSLVLSLATGMGNNVAAIRATRLLEHFATITFIIMTGIAGGVPHPEKADEHVRLGDIVVSDQGGVVQYDFDKETGDATIHRHPPRPPSAILLESVRLLEAGEIEGSRPWLKFVDLIVNQLGITRPSEETDVLASSDDPEIQIPHPKDPQRVKGQPRIHFGSIASANKLLKNPVKRDALRDKFGVKAVEMEGSGIADATWHHEVGYLVVRGVCDYCDSNKGDEWQSYAAAAAAAYTRALLESMPC